MAKILRFQEPLRFEPFTYRGLDQLPVFIHEEGRSFDYFGFTKIPEFLSAGRNLLSLTGTTNLEEGAEIAIEVLDANGNMVPVRTYDYIGHGNERIFSIEIDERIPEGDALITILSIAKGKVVYDKLKQVDRSQSVPANYSGIFNVRWQKRLPVYPRRRNTSDIVYFPNPDIVVEEVFRPFHSLHYNSLLTESYANIAANTSSVYTLCSTASAGVQNTSASLRYETRGEKYFIIAETDPDFGGFTEDMVGGTIFFPEPTNPFPKSFAGPYANPIYNQLEDGDGQGELDTGSQEYSMQGAYNTFIIERISPLQLRVNSPHTTFQGFGRQNQQEVFHQSFDNSDFRLDWAQLPVSYSNSLASGSDEFLTSYAKVTFDKLTPAVGDVTRIKTYCKSAQQAADFRLMSDNIVFPQEMLVQSESMVTRARAGDFSAFGVSSSLETYWTASANAGYNPPVLTAFKMTTGALDTPIIESLQVGDSTVNSTQQLVSQSNFWLVDSKVPMLFQKDQYYQVQFKAFGVNTAQASPHLDVHIFGDAMLDTTFELGKKIGEISDIQNREYVAEENYFDEDKYYGEKFTFKADATEFGYLRFKIDNGLWYIADISVKPYDQFGYTPHHFEIIVPTPKGNVNTMDALDFKFEFYNDVHKAAEFTTTLRNLEFENRNVLTATSLFAVSASIETFFATTPIGDNDWSKEGHMSGQQVIEQPEMTESIWHSGSVGIGDFASTAIGYPLHLRKGATEGNTTLKIDSYSSSILHLAANQGSTYPNSRSAFIKFDHANGVTSSVMGYTEVEDQDPSGAKMSGSTKGSFTIHEQNGRVMSLGVGGHSRFHLVTGKSSRFENEGSHATFIGHQNPKPGTYSYELDLSGSMAIRSGTIFLPDITESASPPMLLALDSGNEVLKTNYNALFQNWDDDDWKISTHYITQSRIGGATGKTVWIADGLVTTGLTPANYIFQISQSTTSPKVRLQGIPENTPQITSLLGTDDDGKVYETDAEYVNAGKLWKDLTTRLTSSVGIEVQGDISASGNIIARQYIVEQITSSIMQDSGSTMFGNSADDFHKFTGAITGSSDISASERVYADAYYSKGQGVLQYSVTDDRILVGNKPTYIQGHLTASKDVSASGNIYGNLTADTDNSVVIYKNGRLYTDEIDSRVWGSTLADLSNGSDNRVVTATDANSLNGESNLTFDGSTLEVTGDITASGAISASGNLGGKTLYISSSQKIADSKLGVLLVDTASGRVYHTGSYGVGGSGGGGSTEAGPDWYKFQGYTHASASQAGATSINDTIWTSGSVMIGHFIGSSSTADSSIANSTTFLPALQVFGRIEQSFMDYDNAGSTIFGAGTALSYSQYTHEGVSKAVPSQGITGGGIDNTYFGAHIARNKATDDASHTEGNTVVGVRAFAGPGGGQRNVIMGWEAGKAHEDADDSTLVGYGAGNRIQSGSGNIYIGSYAGNANVNGEFNVGVGSNALQKVVSASMNTALGHIAGSDITGQKNIAIGFDALKGQTTDSNRIGIGYEATVTTAAFYADQAGTATDNIPYARINTILGVNMTPNSGYNALSVKQVEPAYHAVYIDSLLEDEDLQYGVTWSPSKKVLLLNKSIQRQGSADQPVQFPQGMFAMPASPGFQIVSGTFSILASGSHTASNSIPYFTGSALLMSLQADPAEGGSGSSFMLTGSGHKGIYFTQSAGQSRIGFGTDNPEDEIEFHSDNIKFRRKDEDKGIEMNEEGNFESFAYETAGASTGSELILKFARGTKASPIKLNADDVLGSIRWVQDSGSLYSRGSGELAAIKAVVVETTDAGTTGKLELSLAAGPAEPSAPMLTLNGPTATSTFAGTVVIPGLTINGNITHNGDTDTHIAFTEDQIAFTAGNETIFTIIEDSQDKVMIGDGGDVDFQVKTNGDNNAIRVIGSSDKVGIGTSTPEEKLTVEGAISASGNINVLGNISGSNIHATGDFEGDRKFKISSTSNGNTGGADVVYFGISEGLTAGAIYYFNSSGEWAQADASAVTTSTGMLAVAKGTAVTDGLVLRGMVTLVADPGTIGDKIYLSTAATRAQSSAPTGTGEVVRIIGYCVDSTNKQVYFNPDNTWVELT